MIEVGFDCNQQITVIQANLDEPFKNVINKFLQKTSIHIFIASTVVHKD